MAFFDTAWYVQDNAPTSTVGWSAVPVWPGALTPVSAGTWCRQLATPTVGNERCFVCVVAGTTGAAEPVWVVTRGADSAANVDGTVKWMECTGMAGPCGDLTNCPLDTTVKSATVTLGEVIQNTAGTFLFACTTGGTTSATPPTWNTTTGATTTWNSSSVWTCIGPVSSYTTAFKYPHARLANAYAATWGAAGNKFALASNHAETQSTGITILSPGTAALPCQIYCISSSTTLASPTTATTASISTTGASTFTFNDKYAFYYGVNFNAGSGNNTANLLVGQATSTALYFEQCSLNLTSTGSASILGIGQNITSSDSIITLTGCALTFGSTAQSFSLNTGFGSFTMIGGSIAATGSVPVTLIKGQTGRSSFCLLRDVDLSAITGTIFLLSNSSQFGYFELQNCKLGSGVTIASGAGAGPGSLYVKSHNSDSAATNYRYFYSAYGGVIQQETTIVRTGGATDGTTPLSWNITTSANAQFTQPFVSEEIAQWNDNSGSAKNATCYLTSNTSLTNALIWMEIEYPSSSGSPLGSTVNTRVVPLGTPAALTSDSSTWGGSITNKYKMAVSFTPQMKGPVKMRIYCADPSITAYIDPYIYIS